MQDEVGIRGLSPLPDWPPSIGSRPSQIGSELLTSRQELVPRVPRLRFSLSTFKDFAGHPKQKRSVYLRFVVEMCAGSRQRNLSNIDGSWGPLCQDGRFNIPRESTLPRARTAEYWKSIPPLSTAIFPDCGLLSVWLLRCDPKHGPVRATGSNRQGFVGVIVWLFWVLFSLW